MQQIMFVYAKFTLPLLPT